MSESVQHQQLVRLIIEDVVRLVGKEHISLIAADFIDEYELPPLTNEGFRPDVFFHLGNQLIIGEAKTSNDIERMHSRKQYESYIRKCALFDGKAVFIIAVPWIDHAVIHNILRKIQKKHPGTYLIKILDGIGGAI